MYVLDTNVVSELRRTRPHGGVLAWLDSIPVSALFVSAVTIGEIQTGIETTRVQNASKAAEIEAWLDGLFAVYNILPVNGQAFRLWAKLMNRRSDTLSNDALIAASALVNRFSVVTRNRRDFELFGVQVIDPFTYSGPTP